MRLHTGGCTDTVRESALEVDSGGEREERDTERDRDRDRETDRQTDRETDRQTDREREMFVRAYWIKFCNSENIGLIIYV